MLRSYGAGYKERNCVSNIAYSKKRRLKDEYWEKFANNGSRNLTSIRPNEIMDKHSRVKKICVTCLKNETKHFNSKFCDCCYDAMPKQNCIICSEETLVAAHGKCNKCYWNNKNEGVKNGTK